MPGERVTKRGAPETDRHTFGHFFLRVKGQKNGKSNTCVSTMAVPAIPDFHKATLFGLGKQKGGTVMCPPSSSSAACPVLLLFGYGKLFLNLVQQFQGRPAPWQVQRRFAGFLLLVQQQPQAAMGLAEGGIRPDGVTVRLQRIIMICARLYSQLPVSSRVRDVSRRSARIRAGISRGG